MSYGTIGTYARVPAGSYHVRLLAHGKPANATPLLSWPVTLVSGRAYTLAGEGMGAGRHGAVIDDDLSVPFTGQARVRLIQAASTAGRVTVQAQGGPQLASDLQFPSTTGYTSLAAGHWRIRATGRGPAQQERVTVRPGAIYSIVLLDVRGGGSMMRLLLDAAGAATMPGSASTGGGGTATHIINRPAAPRTPLSWTVLIVAVAGMVVAAATVGRSRRLSR